MKHLFIIASVVFYFGIGAVFAAESAQADTPQEVLNSPNSIPETHQQTVAEQQAIAEEQAQHKKQIQRIVLIGVCYFAVLAAIPAVLIKYRKPIAAAMQRGDGKLSIKRLTIALVVFVILMVLDPLYFLIFGSESVGTVLAQILSIVVLLLVGAAVVWGVRKVRTKWPFVTIVLYSVFFVLMLMPVVWLVLCAFGRPDTDYSGFGMTGLLDFYDSFYGWLFSFSDPSVFIIWAIILAILIAQACLLIVPVRIKHQRPKKRRGFWFTAIIAALLYTVLLFFAGLSIICAIWGDDISEPVFWVLVGILPLNWIGWSVAFCLFSRSMEPESYIRRLMRWLIGGSILELLIAVPSHIIVRHRDVCCAHGFTAAGLATGLAVIFFAFGPGLYFLYADRIGSKQANLPEQAEEPTPKTQQ